MIHSIRCLATVKEANPQQFDFNHIRMVVYPFIFRLMTSLRQSNFSAIELVGLPPQGFIP
jgi:hypothetical protein